MTSGGDDPHSTTSDPRIDPADERRRTYWTAVGAAALVAGVTSICCGGAAAALFAQWLDDERQTMQTIVASTPVPAEDAPRTEGLVVGESRITTLSADDARVRFELEVPERAVALRWEIRCGGPVHADIDFDPPFEGEPEWDALSPDTATSMTWTVSRAAVEEYAAGMATLEVHADDVEPPPGAPWTLHVLATPVFPPATQRLSIGTAASAAVSSETGWFRTFAIPAPEEGTSLRIDLVPEESDLDLLVGYGEPVFDADEAATSATTSAAVETLVLQTGAEGGPRPGGTVYVTVFDPAGGDVPSAFHLFATPGNEAPAELREVAALPDPSDERERARVTLVEVVVGEGRGSGVLVSADGLVLTARHVVAEALPPADGGDRPGDVVLAACFDVRRPPKDIFRARVVAWDEAADVALLRVVSGVFGQPLPEGYRFPFALPAESGPRVGETLTTVGFPQFDGDPERTPPTVSRGILSGYTAGRAPQLARTDAFVASGSSGGSVLDTKGRLVGIVLEGHAESDGGQRLSVYLPVDAIPERIRSMLGW